MAKLTIVAIAFFSLIFFITGLSPKAYGVNAQNQKKEKVVKIHCFVHSIEIYGSPNATTYEVARSSITTDSPTILFGLVRVLDARVTTTPDYNSKQLGRIQGLMTYSDMSVRALTYNGLTFVFNDRVNSTICLLGRHHLDTTHVRELVVAGGTGKFHMARGYVMAKIYYYDLVANYTIVETQIYVYPASMDIPTSFTVEIE